MRTNEYDFMPERGGRATERQSSGRPFNQPTESDRKRPRHPTEKVLQRDDSFPCLSKKFSMMPSDRIENSARWHNLLFLLQIFSLLFNWNLSALSPLTYYSAALYFCRSVVLFLKICCLIFVDRLSHFCRLVVLLLLIVCLISVDRLSHFYRSVVLFLKFGIVSFFVKLVKMRQPI